MIEDSVVKQWNIHKMIKFNVLNSKCYLKSKKKMVVPKNAETENGESAEKLYNGLKTFLKSTYMHFYIFRIALLNVLKQIIT